MEVSTRFIKRLCVIPAAIAVLVAGGAGIASAQQPVKIYVAPPELVGGPWLNTGKAAPITLAARRGHVTIVEFWTFGCINCKRNLPSYAKWQKHFAGRNVLIIGIHTPETAGEKVNANVI